MNPIKKIAVEHINPVMKGLGFKKSSPDTRIYKYNDIVLVLNLQQSMYSVTFMINLGFYFIKNGKDDISKLKEYDCSIRYRLEDLIKNTKEKDEYNDIVHDFGEKYEKDAKVLNKLVEYVEYGTKILLEYKTKEKIKEGIDSGFFDANYFNITAMDIFGIKHEDPSKYANKKSVVIIEHYEPK